MYGLAVTVEPTTEPITREEAKNNLRFPYDTEDLRIEALIKAARRYCETVTGRSFISQTLALTLDRFPCDSDVIRLPRGPVISVSSITYYDTTNVSQTLTASYYQTDLRSLPPRIANVYGRTWPDTYERMAAVTVTYVAGYGSTAASVPLTIKQAIHLLVAHWFNNREAAGPGTVDKVTVLAVQSLLGAEWCGDMTGHFG